MVFPPLPSMGSLLKTNGSVVKIALNSAGGADKQWGDPVKSPTATACSYTEACCFAPTNVTLLELWAFW